MTAANAPNYDPPVEVPKALRQFVSFKKHVPVAMSAAYRVLDEDEEFRSRVAEDLTEEDLGRASFLFLHRPDGWATELADLEEQRFGRAAEAAAVREEQRAERRLREVEAELQKAKSKLAELKQAAADDRDQRRAAVKAEAAAREELERERSQRASGEATRAQLECERDEARTEAASLREELRALREQIASTPQVDVESVKQALVSAGGAVRAAADAIDAAVASLPPPPPTAHAPRARVAAPRRPRREPLRLPGGIVDDSREAAEHLVRVPGAVLIVDGYNATHQVWEERPIPEQRHRLITALAELHARTGIDAQVVFDGEEAAVRDLPVRPGEPVRVTFSPAGVDADDVIIDRVAQLPINVPVLVATNDNRVRAACEKAGANLLSIDQLLAVLRR